MAMRYSRSRIYLTRIHQVIGYMKQLKNPLQNPMEKYSAKAHINLTHVDCHVWYIELWPMLKASSVHFLTHVAHTSTVFNVLQYQFVSDNAVLLHWFARFHSACQCTNLSAAPILGCNALMQHFWKRSTGKGAKWDGYKGAAAPAVVCTEGVDLHQRDLRIPMVVLALAHINHQSIAFEMRAHWHQLFRSLLLMLGACP